MADDDKEIWTSSMGVGLVGGCCCFGVDFGWWNSAKSA